MTYGDSGWRQERLFAVGSRGDADTPARRPTRFTNILYQFDPDTGKRDQRSAGKPRRAMPACRVPARRSSNEVQLNTNVGRRARAADHRPGDLRRKALRPVRNRRRVPGARIPSPTMLRCRTSATSFQRGHGARHAESSRKRRPTTAWPTPRIWTREVVDAAFRRRTSATGSANTSTTIKHITVQGTGDDAFAGFFIKGDAGGLDAPTGRHSMWTPGWQALLLRGQQRHERDLALRRRDRRIHRRVCRQRQRRSERTRARSCSVPTATCTWPAPAPTRFLRYDGTTGAFRDFFVPQGPAALIYPQACCFTPTATFMCPVAIPTK